MSDVTTGPLYGRQGVTCSISAQWRMVVVVVMGGVVRPSREAKLIFWKQNTIYYT